MHRTTREEAETTITFNRHQGTAECCTADPTVAKHWERVGWPVEVPRPIHGWRAADVADGGPLASRRAVQPPEPSKAGRRQG